MPLKVLKSHDVVDQDGQLVSLNVEQLDFKQRSQIKMLCDQRIQADILHMPLPTL